MNYRVLFLLAFIASFLIACASPSGPVKFYSGPPLPKDQLAIVVVPGPITVLSIDGQTVRSPSQESGTYELQLPPGHHLIAFRYYLYWGSNDSGMIVNSKITGVDAQFEAGKTYSLRYKVPRDANEAKDYLTDFKATLVDQSSSQEYSSYEIRDLKEVLAAKNLNQTTPSSSLASSTTASTPAQTTMSADAAVKEDPVKRLKFWWLMATQQQRHEFTEWMKSATESFAPTKAPDNSPPGTIKGVKIKP